MGDLLFLSDQVALDANFQPLAQGDVAAQTRYAFESIQRIVSEAGGTLNDIVEVIAFVKDPRDIEVVLDVGREFFTAAYPASTTVGSLGFQRSELLVSLRAIAHLGPGEKQCLTPNTLAWWRDFPVSRSSSRL